MLYNLVNAVVSARLYEAIRQFERHLRFDLKQDLDDYK